MSYRILYNGETEQKQKTTVCFRLIMSASFFLCFIWMVNAFWPEGRELLKLLLIPGDPDVTLEAAEVFAQELQSGYSLTSAVEHFRNAVLNHGYPG